MIIQMDAITGKCQIVFEYTILEFDTLLEAIEASENIQGNKGNTVTFRGNLEGEIRDELQTKMR